MKILLLLLDFLFLTMDTLRALLRLLPFWKKKQTCSVCGALVLEGESSRRVPSADKYFNLFMFRLLCPDVTEVAVAEDRERQCTQAEGSEGCRLRVWGCLLGLTAIWGMIFFVGISSQRTRAMAQPVATASETKIEEGRKVPVDSRGVEDVSLSGNGQPEKLIDRREARIQQLEAALRLDPESVSVARELIATLITERRFERAALHIRHLDRKIPDDLWLSLYEAEIDAHLHAKSEALDRLASIRAQLRGDLAAQERAVVIYLAAGDQASAQSELAALTTDGAEPRFEVLKLAIQLAVLGGRLEEAHELLDRLSEEERQMPMVQQLSASALLLEGQVASAVEMFVASLSVGEVDRLMAEYMYHVLFSLNRVDEAKRIAEACAASTYRTTREQGWLLLAKLYLQKQIYSETIAFAERVLASNPGDLDAAILLASAWMEKGHKQEAARVLDMLGKRAAGGTVVTLMRARSQRQSDKQHSAEKLLRAAVASQPDNINLTVELGNYYHVDRQLAKARAVYEDYLSRHPGNVVCANNLASVMLDEGADLERAEQLVRDVVKQFPGNPAYTDTLGVILVRRGKAAEGVPLLEHTVRQLPQVPEVRYHLAEAYVAMEQKDRARHQLVVAFKLSSTFVGDREARALLDSLTGEEE